MRLEARTVSVALLVYETEATAKSDKIRNELTMAMPRFVRLLFR